MEEIDHQKNTQCRRFEMKLVGLSVLTRSPPLRDDPLLSPTAWSWTYVPISGGWHGRKQILLPRSSIVKISFSTPPPRMQQDHPTWQQDMWHTTRLKQLNVWISLEGEGGAVGGDKKEKVSAVIRRVSDANGSRLLEALQQVHEFIKLPPGAWFNPSWLESHGGMISCRRVEARRVEKHL